MIILGGSKPLSLQILRYMFQNIMQIQFNPLSAELNTICHFLAQLGAHHIFHVSRIRLNFMLPSP
jgi:hypothetical protein